MLDSVVVVQGIGAMLLMAGSYLVMRVLRMAEEGSRRPRAGGPRAGHPPRSSAGSPDPDEAPRARAA